MINFRDLGGIQAQGGSIVTPGLLFRSSQWADDPNELAAQGIRRRLDLRASFERERKPCRPLPGSQLICLFEGPTPCGSLPPLAPGQILKRGRPGEEMQSRYAGFAVTQAGAMRRFFQILLESKVPTLYYCCQGKDRAGVFTAVLLEALGVSSEEIMRDYLLSNSALDAMNQADYARMGAGMTEEERAVLWSYMAVRPEYLQAFWQAQGDPDVFWEKALGLNGDDKARLRQMYTIKPASDKGGCEQP